MTLTCASRNLIQHVVRVLEHATTVLIQDHVPKPDIGHAVSGKMNNWDFYVRESYDLVRRAENELTINLTHDLEAYIVHLFAYYLDKPKVNTVPVGIKLLSASTLPIPTRKEVLKSVGDECLLINSMEWGKHRWPSNSYYSDMGQMAYMNRAYVDNPPDSIFDELAYEFQTVTKVLRKCSIQ